MRILLDESLPRPLGLALTGHDVSTVRDESWTSLNNGALLRQAAAAFDVLLTADQNIEYQQNLATLPLAIIVLIAESNRAGISGAVSPERACGPQHVEAQDFDPCESLTTSVRAAFRKRGSVLIRP